MSPWVRNWEVTGSQGDLYKVSQKENGDYGCSCPGWKFKKAPKPDCKHIKAIRLALTAPEPKYDLQEAAERAVRERRYTPVAVTAAKPKPQPVASSVTTKVEVEGLQFTVVRKFRFAEE